MNGLSLRGTLCRYTMISFTYGHNSTKLYVVGLSTNVIRAFGNINRNSRRNGVANTKSPISSVFKTSTFLILFLSSFSFCVMPMG